MKNKKEFDLDLFRMLFTDLSRIDKIVSVIPEKSGIDPSRLALQWKSMQLGFKQSNLASFSFGDIFNKFI